MPSPEKTAAQSQVPFGRLLAFIGPCVPFAALGLPLAVTLPEYFANHIGLNLATVGLIFLIVRLFDLLVDPPVGLWMDRTRTKFGRFKLWMLICLPILFVGTWFIFFAKVGVSPTYLGIWLFVLYVGFSIAALSQAGWGSILSTDYNERSKIFAWWQGGNIGGIILVLLIPVIVQDVLHLSYATGVQAMGAFILVTMPLTIGAALWLVPERQSDAPAHGLSLRDYFVMLRRRNVRRILLADLFTGLAPGVMGALFFFYFEMTKGFARNQSSVAMFLYFVAGILGAPLWNWVAKRFSKHVALVASCLISAVIYATMSLVPSGNVPVCYAVIFLNGIPYASSLLLTRALMSDIGDEVMLETGHDHKGTLMAILSATTKLGYAFSVFTLWVLGTLGFDNKLGVHNSPRALLWLEIFFIGLPVLFLILGALAMRGYDLTPARHRDILDRLVERKTT
jgi:Na+/melibiose symporter-like transporter